jgi:hypothetical protein
MLLIRRMLCWWMVLLLPSWAQAQGATFTVWPVDPLTNVFRDASAGPDKQAVADVARGETATFQIVVKSTDPMTRVRCEIKPPASDGAVRRTISPARVRYVGYVPVDKGVPNPPHDQLRKPPGDFPDPLLEVPQIDVKANDAQPIWITIKIPLTANPGTYRGEAKVRATVGRSEKSQTVPLVLNVYNATVNQSRLLVTNWFQMSNGPKPFPKKDSPLYWELLRRYAIDMAEHRQNVARAAPLRLVEYSGPDNRLRFDFSEFDQWVQTFLTAGVNARIEGQQFGWRKGDWNGPFVVSTYSVKSGKLEERKVDPTSAEAQQFYAQFLPALCGHLRQRNWLRMYVQHLADEPVDANAESYNAIAALVKKYAPELRTLDASYTTKIAGAVNIWVPHINVFQQNNSFFQDRKKAGDEVWFYTCVAAQGEYANRYIELPLAKTRLLHWVNFKYGASGYLHWAYNYWTEDPFTKTTQLRDGGLFLPAGEAWIVYPGKDGVIDSIRFEAMRDGIADYELFAQLAEKDPTAAQELVARQVLDFNRYDCDLTKFRETRRELLKRLATGG